VSIKNVYKQKAWKWGGFLVASGKYLTFALEKEYYGFPIEQIKEIIGMMAINPIPDAPPFMKGVINLRGQIIPVIDLRIKLGKAERPYTDRNCIIILDILEGGGPNQARYLGVIVDTVADVAAFPAEAIDPPPGSGLVLAGIGKLKDRVYLLLKAEQLRIMGDEGTVVMSME